MVCCVGNNAFKSKTRSYLGSISARRWLSDSVAEIHAKLGAATTPPLRENPFVGRERDGRGGGPESGGEKVADTAPKERPPRPYNGTDATYHH